jgi:hypothetical protein
MVTLSGGWRRGTVRSASGPPKRPDPPTPSGGDGSISLPCPIASDRSRECNEGACSFGWTGARPVPGGLVHVFFRAMYRRQPRGQRQSADTSPAGHFRSVPISGHSQGASACLNGARSGLSNDVGLFAVEGRGRLRAPRSNTRTRWPHRTTRTLSFMATTTTGRLPEREWRAFRSMVLRRSRTRHEARCAISPSSRGPGFPFTISRRLTALENSTPCGQSRTSSRRAHGVEEACDVRLQPLGLLRQPTG